VKKAFQLALFALLLSCPAWATWAVVQHTSNTCTTASQTCNIAVSSTGTGNVIVIGIGIASNAEQIVSVSGGGTYTHPATACHSADGTTRGADCAYTLASTSGTTTITVTRTDATSFGWNASATEYSFTSGPVSLDTGTPQVRDQTTTVTGPAGVTLTLSGTNDAIYQMIEGTAPTAVTSPYSTNQNFSANLGAASSINTVSGTAPTWTQTSAKAALSAIAFTETGGGASPASRLPILGVGQ
jgi:hypothetical protein